MRERKHDGAENHCGARIVRENGKVRKQTEGKDVAKESGAGGKVEAGGPHMLRPRGQYGYTARPSSDSRPGSFP